MRSPVQLKTSHRHATWLVPTWLAASWAYLGWVLISGSA